MAKCKKTILVLGKATRCNRNLIAGKCPNCKHVDEKNKSGKVPAGYFTGNGVKNPKEKHGF